jgi:hypothetical protein
LEVEDRGAISEADNVSLTTPAPSGSSTAAQIQITRRLRRSASLLKGDHSWLFLAFPVPEKFDRRILCDPKIDHYLDPPPVSSTQIVEDMAIYQTEAEVRILAAYTSLSTRHDKIP